MNDLLTRKKHSKRIAKLAFFAGIIDKEIYNSLYLEQYLEQRITKRKNKYGWKTHRYYNELYFCTCDYWGEYNENNLIDYIAETLFWTIGYIENNKYISTISFNLKTKNIIKVLNSIGKNGWKIFNEKYKNKE